MASAMLKAHDHVDAMQLDIKDALSAALLRATEAGCPKNSLLSLISKEEWASMDARAENILVFDPE
jgi:hypothetical protein